MKKRLSAGILAVATTLSLSTATALAAEGSSTSIDKGSSDKNDDGYSDAHYGSAEQELELLKGSSTKQQLSSAEAHQKVYGSSYDNDKKKDYPIGTTADILWGTGIAAAILGVIGFLMQGGMITIPGL